MVIICQNNSARRDLSKRCVDFLAVAFDFGGYDYWR